MDVALGSALLIAACTLLWKCLPRENEVIPLLRKPGMEITATLLFVTGLSVGTALLLRGFLSY
jgi:hypothetical protein